MHSNIGIFFWSVCIFAQCIQADEDFKIFQQKFNKLYSSSSELALRQQIFKNNLAKIEDHNKKYSQSLVSYKMGVNQFTDLTEDEFRSRLKTLPLNQTMLANAPVMKMSNVNVSNIPQSVDWRDKGIVTPVKDQGVCGACWAFSATGTIEGQLALKYGKPTSLSEQQLLDCDKTKYTKGCSGGVVQAALEYVKKCGLATEDKYPYKTYEDSCKSVKSVAAKVKGYVNVPAFNEDALKYAVGTIGPVSVGMNADQLKGYKAGIFNPIFCSEEVNHGVLVVGYHESDYWIIKNSWGTQWGENGYFRMKMVAIKGLCGITTQSCYPTGVTNSAYALVSSVYLYSLFALAISTLFICI